MNTTLTKQGRSPVQEPLTETEATDLNSYEQVIECGMETFVEVGTALLEIRDRRLYRLTHGSFATYCEERWGFARRQADRMIQAAGVIKELSPIGLTLPSKVSPIGLTLPSTESQARELARVEPSERAGVWGEATEVAAAEGRPLTARDVAAAASPHVSHNSGQNEWYTPPEYILAARAVLGRIDCDPASSEIANRTVGAAKFFDKEADGLKRKWGERIYLNPPYAQPLVAHFSEALALKVESGEVQQAIVLVNNATETEWFQRLLSVAAAVCFPRSRIKFLDTEGNPGGAPLQGQAILYVGTNPKVFAEVFGTFGTVLWKK